MSKARDFISEAAKVHYCSQLGISHESIERVCMVSRLVQYIDKSDLEPNPFKPDEFDDDLGVSVTEKSELCRHITSRIHNMAVPDGYMCVGMIRKDGAMVYGIAQTPKTDGDPEETQS